MNPITAAALISFGLGLLVGGNREDTGRRMMQYLFFGHVVVLAGAWALGNARSLSDGLVHLFVPIGAAVVGYTAGDLLEGYVPQPRARAAVGIALGIVVCAAFAVGFPPSDY